MIDSNRLAELTYFNTILNYAQIDSDEERDKKLDRIEKKLDYIISKLGGEDVD